MTASASILIEKLVPGGDGLGHLETGVVFVPLTAPGDVVSLKNVQKRRGVFFADVDEFVERSSDRRDPPCPWFGRCGGCQWMHLEYEGQLRWKEDTFRQALKRIGHLHQPLSMVIHPAPAEFQCRCRARLQVKGGDVGFYQRASNNVVPWDRCMLLPETLNQAIQELRAWFRQNRPPAALKAFEIALGPVGPGMTLAWTLSRSKGSGSLARRIMGGVQKISFPGDGSLAGQAAHDERGRFIADMGGSAAWEVAGIRMQASPGTFSQVNPEVNTVLVDRVLAHLRTMGASSLLDLYCGNGNFSLPAAASGIRTVGVESSPGAIRDARAAAGSGSSFIEMDVSRFLAGDHDEPDAVIVDPPRTGLPAEVATVLGAGGPGWIIYVSCEPSTLARDLGRLIEAGYDVTDLELFDMFPQTSHMEALVVMKRRRTDARRP